MKIWWLDNEYSDYIILASTREAAWRRLGEIGILPFGHVDDPNGVPCAAYHDLEEVTDGFRIDNPHDLEFLL